MEIDIQNWENSLKIITIIQKPLTYNVCNKEMYVIKMDI